MNSQSNSGTLAVMLDASNDYLSAFQTALEIYGSAKLSDFLPPPDHRDYLEILGELVRHEFGHGWRTGTPTPLETYEARYPELFADPVFTLKITHDEFILRQQPGERFPATEDRPSASADSSSGSIADIAELYSELEGYAATERGLNNDPFAGAPMFEIGETRDDRASRHASSVLEPVEPEIASKLAAVAFDMPKVGDDFLGFGLLAELGKGAFGRVFLAQQGDLAGRLVALKVATGLFDESQTLAQLQHTHIVPIYSFHHAQPFQAVCMPYLGSTTLADLLHDIRSLKSLPNSGRNILSTLNERKRASTRNFEDSTRDGSLSASRIAAESLRGLPATAARQPSARPMPSPLVELEGLNYVDSILWLAVRLTDGLAHAHERGILHRDLKPANILLTDEGVPMLLDFNLAQDTKQDTSAERASIGGTLPYMSPEHLDAFRGQGKAVDTRSDVYSFGVILFELLTGAAPFGNYRKLPIREVVERMIQDRLQGAPGLRKINPTIPHAVEAIILKCLAADPERRYQSARQLQEDLQRQLAHLPLKHAPNRSLRERFRKFRRRHPRLTSLTSVILMSALMLGGLMSLFVVREERRLGLEARATLLQFDDDARLTHILLGARSAKNQLDEGDRTCRATLGRFHILDNPRWRDTSAVQRLPAPEQERLQIEAGQLLILLAHAQLLAAEREKDAGRRSSLIEDGLHFCSRAGECFPEDQPPQALLKQQAELYRRQGAREKADVFLERARQAKLGTVQDRYMAARQLADEGRFRAALPLVKEGIRLAPQYFNLHFLQGICHDHLAQHAEAIECYRTCIALRPGFHPSYYNRGLTYLRQGNLSSAKEDFDQVLRMKDTHAESYVHRGLALQGMLKYREAEADFTAALERGFDQTRIYFLRARVREKAGDAEGAKKDLAEGRRREPKDELSWIARGLAFLPADPKRALSDFEKAHELNPRSQAALQNKAHVLGKYFKRTQEAIDALDAAMVYYPDSSALVAGRGVYLARLGKREEALKAAEQALVLDTNPPNLYQVAGIYALTSRKVADDRQEAFRLLSAALKKGFGFDYLEIDRDLDPIRDMPAFRRIVDGARAMHAPAAGKR